MNQILKAGVQAACKIVSHSLDLVGKTIQAGMTTEYIDQICYEYITGQGGRSGCNGYKGYPKNVCISVNEVVCHGVPNNQIIQNGDIVNVDIVVEFNGYYGDAARMFCIGDVNPDALNLVEATRAARDHGIAVVRPGATLGDIGHAIESYITKNTTYSIVKQFCGHGIGRKMHEPPQIMNYGMPGQGAKITEGMIFTVEPIVCIGKPSLIELEDGWTTITQDNSWAAQWEHTIYVTKNGCEILT